VKNIELEVLVIKMMHKKYAHWNTK